MYNRNSYFDDFFKTVLEPEETYGYYFYNMKFAPLTDYLLYQSMAPLLNKHLIVCFTNRRIILCEMDGVTGKLTDNMAAIDIQDVKDISIKKGLMKTNVKVVFSDDSAVSFNPNNICIGLSRHKENLLKLNELFSA